MIKMKTNVTPGETPAEITVSMIDQDLKDGISKPEMAIKYGIKPWEVDEMFKHPDLKGRRPSRKKTLSFTFVDDTTETTQFPSSMNDVTNELEAPPTIEDTLALVEEQEMEVNPNQVTLEQAIDEAIESVEEVKDQMKETQEAIITMLSPTEFETPEETLLKAATESDTYDGEEDDDYISDEVTEEVEIDESDDTFEL
jgi:hypothetical protein